MAVYRAVGGHGFVFDDFGLIHENPPVARGLGAEGLRWALLSSHGANWHPVTWLLHMANVSLFGLDAGPHHLVCLAWHCAGERARVPRAQVADGGALAAGLRRRALRAAPAPRRGRRLDRGDQGPRERRLLAARGRRLGPLRAAADARPVRGRRGADGPGPHGKADAGRAPRGAPAARLVAARAAGPRGARRAHGGAAPAREGAAACPGGGGRRRGLPRPARRRRGGLARRLHPGRPRCQRPGLDGGVPARHPLARGPRRLLPAPPLRVGGVGDRRGAGARRRGDRGGRRPAPPLPGAARRLGVVPGRPAPRDRAGAGRRPGARRPLHVPAADRPRRRRRLVRGAPGAGAARARRRRSPSPRWGRSPPSALPPRGRSAPGATPRRSGGGLSR